MKFGQRLKSDKGFRNKLILVFIVIILIMGNIKDEKKGFQDPAICDQFDIDWLGYTDSVPCIDAGCFVTEGLLNVGRHCVSCGGTGVILEAGSASASISCCSGSGEEREDGTILCKTSTPPGGGESSVCDTNLQKSLAGLLDMAGLGSLGCKMKYYIVAFGGGFLALMMLMAAI